MRRTALEHVLIWALAAVFVAVAVALFTSCTSLEGRRLLRGVHPFVAMNRGTTSYPINNKRDLDMESYSFGFTFDLGALVPPDPIPVYVDTRAPVAAPPAVVPCVHDWVQDRDGCVYCSNCNLTPDEAIAQEVK